VALLRDSMQPKKAFSGDIVSPYQVAIICLLNTSCLGNGLHPLAHFVISPTSWPPSDRSVLVAAYLSFYQQKFQRFHQIWIE
jgi:hypothetical protein